MKLVLRIVSFSTALLVYFGTFYLLMVLSLNRELDYVVYEQYGSLLLQGWIRTIQVSLTAIIFSLIIGLLLYVMQQSGIHFLYFISEIHKTVIFGTPLVVLAIISYYFIGNSVGIDSKFWIGVFTLAFYIAAYIADIYKGAIESIHINQWQTAKMFGFSRVQTYRHIIFPQVLMTILPPLAGQFALTIKGSALLSYMALDEWLNSINTVQATSYRYTEGYIIVSVGYWLITIPLILAVRYLEGQLNYKKGAVIK